MDHELAGAAAYQPGRCCMCTHQMAALFSVKSHNGCHLESVMSNQKSDWASQLRDQELKLTKA